MEFQMTTKNTTSIPNYKMSWYVAFAMHLDISRYIVKATVLKMPKRLNNFERRE